MGPLNTLSHLFWLCSLVAVHISPLILLLLFLLVFVRRGLSFRLLLLLLCLLSIPFQLVYWSRGGCTRPGRKKIVDSAPISLLFFTQGAPCWMMPMFTYLAWRCKVCCCSWHQGWAWRSWRQERTPWRRFCPCCPQVWAPEGSTVR